MSALTYINVLPASKSEAEDFIRQILSEVESGNVDPLTLLIHLKWIIKTVEAIEAKIKPAALSEAEKYGKAFNKMGFKIEQCEVGVKYNFEVCGDVVLNDFSTKIKELSEHKKDREAMLKTLKSPLNYYDEGTGETFVISPPIKTSTTSLKFTAE